MDEIKKKKEEKNHAFYFIKLVMMHVDKEEISENDKNLLKFFSNFVSNNSNFKYNKTYLLENIDKLCDSLKIIKQKKIDLQLKTTKDNIINYIPEDFFMLVDNLFILDSELGFCLPYDPRLTEIEDKFLNYIKLFNLRNINKDTYMLNMISKISKKNYVKTLKINDLNMKNYEFKSLIYFLSKGKENGSN